MPTPPPPVIPLTATPVPNTNNMKWQASYSPPSSTYQGKSSYSFTPEISPNPSPFPNKSVTPNITATDDTNGNDQTSYSNLNSSPQQVSMTVTVTGASNFGPNLTITLVLDYGVGKP